MDYLTATKAIIKFFAEGWDNATPVAYPDVAFTPPNGSTWLRFNLQHFNGYQASIGSPGANRFRRDALVTIQVFAVEGKAALDALAKADRVVDIFRDKTYSGIRFFDVQLKEIGADGAGLHQINVLAYVQYDRIA